MPSEWSKIRLGMPRQDLLGILNDEVVDLRDLKGYDSASRSVSIFGLSSYWQLWIVYDASGRVSKADARFVTHDCGLFNTKPKSVY